MGLEKEKALELRGVGFKAQSWLHTDFRHTNIVKQGMQQPRHKANKASSTLLASYIAATIMMPCLSDHTKWSYNKQ